MPTVKLVVIGASGVGKTSLRGQYISGRFSNGYRATIGADFITKTLPHPSNSADTVTLQIWDTAGQERFSSLSTAFFRGADAALLMFDVNTPATMAALVKWWEEFRERAPVRDEEMEDYCCVVVGNKVDLAERGAVTEAEARTFLEELVPLSASPILGDEEEDLLASSLVTIRPPESPPPPSESISIHQPLPSPSPSHSPLHHLSKSRSRSSSHFYGGTMTTTHTTLTVHHTPSSSLFDVYHSARSSPEPSSSYYSSTSSPASPNTSLRRPRRLTTLSTGSTSSGSATTITPSLFAREHTSPSPTTPTLTSTTTTPEDDPDPDPEPYAFPPLPPPPARGPQLFFTSAKTGEGVSDVFEYVARRVVRSWEYEERIAARRVRVGVGGVNRDVDGDVVRLGLQGSRRRGMGGCCAS